MKIMSSSHVLLRWDLLACAVRDTITQALLVSIVGAYWGLATRPGEPIILHGTINSTIAGRSTTSKMTSTIAGNRIGSSRFFIFTVASIPATCLCSVDRGGYNDIISTITFSRWWTNELWKYSFVAANLSQNYLTCLLRSTCMKIYEYFLIKFVVKIEIFWKNFL